MQDLKALYGRRYKVRWEAPASSHCQDVWYQVVLCKYGHIYQHDEGWLGWAAPRRGHISRAVASLPGVEMVQDADDGPNIVFPLAMFEDVAKLVKPRRRRQLTPEQREQAAARLRQWQASPGERVGGRADSVQRSST